MWKSPIMFKVENFNFRELFFVFFLTELDLPKGVVIQKKAGSLNGLCSTDKH